jgi:c-di-AMP phosphodiesterase-like protein
MDLLSVQEILEGPYADDIREWQKKSREAGDFTAANSLVIGVADVTPTKLLLDPSSVDKNGEWAVIQHHKDEEYSYSSFLEWIEESADGFRELLEERHKNNLK